MKASELAGRLGYDIVGTDHEITGISYAAEAGVRDLAVIKNRTQIRQTQANVLLTPPVITDTDKTLIMSYDEIEMAVVRACSVLAEAGVLADYGLPEVLERTEDRFYTGLRVKISHSAKIYPGVVIGNDVSIGDNCVIEPFTVIGSGTVLADHVFIGSGSKIGAESFYHAYDEWEGFSHFTGCGRTWIGEGTHIGSQSVVQRGTISDTVIGSHCMIGNCIDIGHDVKIGNHCKIVSQTGIAGNAILGNYVTVYGQAGISNNVVIGDYVTVKPKTIVSRSIEDGQVVFGYFGRNFNEELELAAKIRRFFERKED
ncbi:MAG: hypothetical protein K2N87_12200 [Eubacterium sp.]|nr:hypothetical protein [Eubacterium sp.]